MAKIFVLGLALAIGLSACEKAPEQQAKENADKTLMKALKKAKTDAKEMEERLHRCRQGKGTPEDHCSHDII